MNANTISQRLRAACALFLLVLFVTPYVPAQSGGSYQVTSSVVAGGGGDSSGGSFSLSATIGQAVTAISSGAAYVLSSGFWAAECPNITVNPATLPAASLNIAYTQQLTASGGFGSYTYALTAGTLPNGVTLTGDTLAGAPTQSGDFSLVITATDANNCKGQAGYTLTVGTGAPVYESDVAPRPNGNGSLSATDITQTRRFVAGTDTPALGSEYQRADSAPRASFGNGAVSATDITQARRYVAGTDPLTNAAGPNAPSGGIPQPARLHTPTARVVRVVSQTVTPGNQAVVPIELDSMGDEVALSFSISYDPAILSIAGDQNRIALGSGVPAGTTLTRGLTQEAQGRLGIVLDSANAFAAGARQLVTITFDITGNTLATPISFGDQPTVRDISDDQAQSLLATYANGTVGVTAPTVAHIVKQEARHFPDGNLIQWQSSFEVNNLGFHVYRQDSGISNLQSQIPNLKSEIPPATRITPNLIAGSGLTYSGPTRLNSGYSYSWWDADAPADAVYWIEDVDFDGTTRLHGPLPMAECGLRNAECFAASALRPPSSSTLNQLNETGNATLIKGLPTELWKSAFNPQSAIRNLQSEQPQSVAALKIAIRQAGWYRINGAQLFAQGLEASADARFLQLHADGQQIPLLVRTQDGRDAAPLGSNGVIEFYATPRDTRETDTRTYGLIVGDTPGLRIGPPVRVAGGGSDISNLASGIPEPEIPDAKSGISNLASGIPGPEIPNAKQNPTPNSFPYTIERKDRTLYFAALNNGEDTENFFGTVVTQTPVNQTLRIAKLDNAANAQASVTVILQAATEGAHRVRIQLNGNDLGFMEWTGRARRTARFNFVPTALQEGDNTLTLTAPASGDVSVVDVLRLTYPRRYEAENNSLLLTTGARNGLTINGFTNNQIRVFDLTDPARAFQVAARVETDTAGYAARLNTRLVNRTLLAVTDSQALAPAALTAAAPTQWATPNHAADFLIITPRAFRAALAPLAQLRAAQGLQTEIVNLEDLYNELSGGDKNVNALRQFLRYTRAHWQRAPQYVLLAGDASLDPRNYLNLGDFDFVPTGYVGTYYLETSSDESLTDFDGDGIGEMSVGRLPARTPEQAALLVNKILSFTPHAPDGGLFVSDRPEGYDFVALNQAVRQQLPAGMPAHFINRADSDDPATRQALITALNQGPSLVNYAGHGSVEVWTGAPILNSADALGLNNNRLPLVVAMNCLNGYFHDVSTVSLAEGFLNAPNGGAIAVWASSSLTTATAQAPANREFVRRLYQAGTLTRLGDAARLAKQQTNDADVRRTWILLGDPTLTVQ